jgi:hypothetical protein
MKIARILQISVLCAGMAGFRSQGALLNIGQPTSSPFSAYFSPGSMTVNYTSSSGVLTATGTSDTYTSGVDSPGTHGAYNKTGFNGSFSLTADIANVGGIWEVTGGSVTVEGDLFNPGVAGHSTDLLLTANLRTGNGTLGYLAGSKELDFLFTVSGGNASIVRDFFGDNTGKGAIALNLGTIVGTYNGDFSHSFSTTPTSNGYMFVPEPAAYAWAGSVVALLSLSRSLCRKKEFFKA